MSRQILPRSPHKDQESYEARLHFAVTREFDNLNTKAEGLRMMRLSAFNSATAAPTGNQWAAGDKVWNSAPAEAGGVGSKYVTIGWICTVSGTPGTWVEMRTLTGN